MTEALNNDGLQPSNGGTPVTTETPTPPLSSGTAPALTDKEAASTASGWKPYTDDPAKTAEENTAARAANDANKPQAVKDDEARQAAMIAPIDFAKLKLPEGFTADEASSKEFTDIVNDDKLSRGERAQRLIDLQAKFVKAGAEKLTESWQKLQGDWQEQVKKDPELGGENLPKTLSNINWLLSQYGGPEDGKAVREVFALTGAGNNIHIARLFNNVALKLREGGPISGGQPASGPGAKDIYPNSNLNP